MAQVWKVRPVRLGGVPLNGLGAIEPHHVSAVGAATNGAVALAGVALMAGRRYSGAYVLMIAAAVVGGAIGIAKALGSKKL